MTGAALLDRRRAAADFVIAVAILFATTPFVRPVAEFLRSNGLLRISTFGLLGASALVAGIGIARAAVSRRLERPLLLVVAATLFSVAFFQARLPEERVHLVEYAVIGVLALRVAAVGDLSPRDRAIAAFLLAFLAGWIDEAIQGLLPSRVYDPLDVALNALGSALAIVAAEFSLAPGGAGAGAARRRSGSA